MQCSDPFFLLHEFDNNYWLEKKFVIVVWDRLSQSQFQFQNWTRTRTRYEMCLPRKPQRRQWAMPLTCIAVIWPDSVLTTVGHLYLVLARAQTCRYRYRIPEGYGIYQTSSQVISRQVNNVF